MWKKLRGPEGRLLWRKGKQDCLQPARGLRAGGRTSRRRGGYFVWEKGVVVEEKKRRTRFTSTGGPRRDRGLLSLRCPTRE